jgi:choline-sulfatase
MRRGVFLLAVLFLLVGCRRQEAPHPPVILISIDTLRADRVTPALMPNVTALAKDGVSYRRAWSHCPLTLPSHLSMFTGLLPPEHGVRDNVGYRFDAAKHPTLASLFRANGYATGAAISAYVLRGATGVSAGFDEYDDAIGIVDGAPAGALQRAGSVTESIAERWIAGHESRPFFYFLHLYEPHTPYEPTYDDDVHRADAIVGTLIAFLKQRGIYDRATIALVSDHGEGLMEHGEQEHGVFLYREALQVPFIIKYPGGAVRGSRDEAQLIDLLPLLLEAAHLAAPARTNRPFIYSETLYPRIHFGWSELRSAVEGGWHYVDAPKAELFALDRDPEEQHDMEAAERREVTHLRARLGEVGGAFTAPEAVDAEEQKKLAALGYVSAGSGASGPLPDPKEHIGDLAILKAIAASPRDAIPKMEKLLAGNPAWSDVRDQLGAAYEAAGDPARAAKVYEEGIRATPRLAPEFALSAASALLEAGDPAGAEAHARLAEAGEPAEAHLLLGEIALARGDLAAASAHATAAESFRAERGHALFLSARIAAAQRDHPRALALFDEVQHAHAESGESLPQHFDYAVADTLARSGRVPEAVAAFGRAIDAEPRDRRAYADLALLQFAGGDAAGADATLARLVARNPAQREFAEKTRARLATLRGRVRP